LDSLRIIRLRVSPARDRSTRASVARLLSVMCVLASAAAISACGDAASTGAPSAAPGAGARASGGPRPSLPSVVTAVAQLQAFGSEVEAVGTARANESVEVTSKVTNTVTRIRFAEGQPVARGAVLIEFDAAEARADLAEAQAALAESRRQFARSQDLATRKLIPESQLDQIGATVEGNKARVAGAEARLANTLIRAPFSGRTGFRRVSVGSLVAPGTLITTLDDASVIKLEFSLPEAQLFLVEKSAPVVATTVGLPGREFAGAVTAVDSRIDPVSRSVLVRAEIANRDAVLRPGMFMAVRLKGRVAPAVLVPEAALVPEQGRMFVFVVDGEKAVRKEVRIGRRTPGSVEITEGLAGGESVIVEGTQNVRDGGDVAVVSAAQPPAAGAPGAT
jgi:membrane fusion protein, multidrug efflux system